MSERVGLSQIKGSNPKLLALEDKFLKVFAFRLCNKFIPYDQAGLGCGVSPTDGPAILVWLPLFSAIMNSVHIV